MKRKIRFTLLCTAVGIVLAGLLGWQVYRDWFSYNEHPDLSQKIDIAQRSSAFILSPESWEIFLNENFIEGIYIGEVQEPDESNNKMFQNGRAAFQITGVVAEGSLHLQPGDVIEIGFSGMLMSDLELEEVEIFHPGDRILGFFTYLDTYW